MSSFDKEKEVEFCVLGSDHILVTMVDFDIICEGAKNKLVEMDNSERRKYFCDSLRLRAAFELAGINVADITKSLP